MQWLGLCAFTELRPRVQSLVRELKSHKPHGRQKKKKNKTREKRRKGEKGVLGENKIPFSPKEMVKSISNRQHTLCEDVCVCVYVGGATGKCGESLVQSEARWLCSVTVRRWAAPRLESDPRAAPSQEAHPQQSSSLLGAPCRRRRLGGRLQNSLSRVECLPRTAQTPPRTWFKNTMLPKDTPLETAVWKIQC